MKKILVVDDDESIRWVLQKSLGKAGYDVSTVEDPLKAVSMAEKEDYPVILLDILMPGMNGFEVLDRIGTDNRAVIVMTAQGTMKNAIEAMRRGAYDYITKPFDLDELALIVKRAFDDLATKVRVKNLETVVREKHDIGSLVGRSSAMRDIYKLIGRVADKDITVLVRGESGTGKELVAKALHFNSNRIGRPFLAINAATIARDLLESELFGHEKGAFTGAATVKQGKFEVAEGGTIFLDEIGEMSLDLQAKLLRVIEEKTFFRVGGNVPINVDVRIVAATNRDLERAVREKQFREDLYYRLHVLPINLPPLRERREDIEDLVDHFLRLASEEMGLSPKRMSKDALALLFAYSWPGNVRELENAIRRALVVTSGSIVGGDAIRSAIPGLEEDATGKEGLRDSLKAKVRGYVESVAGAHNGDIYKEVVSYVERILIEAVLKESKGNQVVAADMLGINRNTLHKKINELGVDDGLWRRKRGRGSSVRVK